MATFSASGIPDPTPNVLFNAAGVDQAVQANQRNALLNTGLAQDLTDRTTIRDNAAGMMAGDQAATAKAMGANPHMAGEFISGLGQLQGDQRTQAIFDMNGTAGLAQSIMRAPPDQRAALWAIGRKQLMDTGHSRLPPEEYPGDAAMYTARGIATTALEQLNGESQFPSTSTQSPWAFPSSGGTSGGQPGPASGQYGGQGSSVFDGSGDGSAPAAPATLAGPLAQAESGGRADIVNGKGYVGKYQFGSDRLQDLGMYQPGQPGETPNTWGGTLNIPGHPEVRTLADFKRSPAAQDSAYQAHEANIDQAIAANPAAQGMDQNGLRAVAHLGGVDGMNRFIATGGRYNPNDGKTSLAAYYRRFSGGAPAQVGSAAGAPVAPPDAVAGGFGGGTVQAGAAPVQMASTAGTTGLPATMTDANPGSYAGVGPAQPGPAANPVAAPVARPGAPARPGPALNSTTQNALARLGDASAVVPIDARNGPVPMPAGTSYRVGAGPVQTAGANADVVSVDPRNAGVPLPQGTSYSVGGGPTQVSGQQPGAAGQPPSAAGQAGAQGSLVVGDSLAQGIGQANGIAGVSQVGASPQVVMAQISAMPPAQVAGKNVILSGGASNSPSDVALVGQQIAALKAKGAASVMVVGVGSRPDLAPLNDQLADIAARNGAQFTGPVPSGQDGVHPPPAGYRGLGLNGGGSPAPSMPNAPGQQPTPVGDAIRASRGIPVPPSIHSQAGGTYGGARGAQPAMSAQDAVAQASRDLGASLDAMTPGDANAAVQQRAQQLMAGPGAPATSSVDGLPYTPAQPQTAPAGVGGQRNALAGAVGDPTPQQPNALSGLGQPSPQPAPAPAPAQQQGPDAQPLYVKGRPIEYPGMPGFILGQDASGNRVPIRAGIPKLTATNVGGTVIYSDPTTGREVSRNTVGNTGRLTQVRNPDGSLSYITPSGQPVASTGSSLPLDLGKQDYERDQKVAEEAANGLGQLRQQEMTLRDTRDVAQNLTATGFYGESKAQLASFIAGTFGDGPAKALQASLSLDDPSKSEQFRKLTFASASQQENANVGARGGFNLTQMYASANPGLQSQKDTIRDILNVQQIANLAHQDFTQGQLNHIAQQGQAFRSNPGSGYQPSSAYAQQWANGTSPRLYLAAAEALNQQPYAAWSKGLSDPEKQQALAIASRVNNTASYMGPQGPAALTQYGAPGGGQGSGQTGTRQASTPAPAAQAGPSSGAGPAVGTVSRGYRFNGGDPANPASWSRAQ